MYSDNNKRIIVHLIRVKFFAVFYMGALKNMRNLEQDEQHYATVTQAQLNNIHQSGSRNSCK